MTDVLDHVAGPAQELPEEAERQRRLIEQFLDEDEVVVSKKRKAPSKSRKKKVVVDEELEEDFEEDLEEDLEDVKPPTRKNKVTRGPRQTKASPVGNATLDDVLDAERAEIVTITTPVGPFKLQAKHVMVNETSMAFFILEEAAPTLTFGSTFDISHRDKVRTVVYADGTYSLEKTGSRYKLITLMRQLEE